MCLHLPAPLRLAALALALWTPRAAASSTALVDPACDADGDGVVDSIGADYAEGQQYGNLLNFYAVTLGSSPLHGADPMGPLAVDAGLELSYIPQLSCAERAVFGGQKTEHTNRSPLFPRLHLTLGLPEGVYLGLSGIPPVRAFGVKTGVLAGELGYGHTFFEHLELGARASGVLERVVGDLAGPLPNETATDDAFSAQVWAVEGMAAWRVGIGAVDLRPYLGAGYTRVHAGMHIGEDGVDVPGSQAEMGRMQYWGPVGEVGASTRWRRWEGALEAYMVPLSLVDPGNPRFFFAPRLMVGYNVGKGQTGG